MKRTIGTILQCALLCALLSVVLTLPAAAGFRDVPANHWAKDSIQRSVDLGFFSARSDNTFGLGQPVTRAEFAVALCRFFGWDATAPESPRFDDVPLSASYAGAVETAYQRGVIVTQNSSFRPNDAITREELAVMMVRALGYSTLVNVSLDAGYSFRDVTTNAGYIAMTYELGLMNGTSKTAFSPARAASREQAAVILMRLYDRLHVQDTQLVALVTSPQDVEVLDAAVIPAAKLINVSDQPTIYVNMSQETIASIQSAAKQANIPALLRVVSGVTALKGDIDTSAAAIVNAVTTGGYDGLYLEIPQLDHLETAGMNQLVKALDASLGEMDFYISVEAPIRQLKSDGYDYDALAAAADHLVLRVGVEEDTSAALVTAPLDPIEEIYYALTTLNDTIDPAKLSLMIATTPSAWMEGRAYTLADGELEALLTHENTQIYYSNRYACAYLTHTTENGKTLVVWYLNEDALMARLQLAKAAGLGQLCVDELTPQESGESPETAEEAAA